MVYVCGKIASLLEPGPDILGDPPMILSGAKTGPISCHNINSPNGAGEFGTAQVLRLVHETNVQRTTAVP
jgi:hypothetical protein